MKPTEDKAQKSERAAEAALKLIEKHGLDKLTIAQVARLAKVSRPWIYKYIGPGQTELIDFAVDHFGRMLSALDRRDNPKTPQDWINSTLTGTLELIDLATAKPWLISLYFRYRGTLTIPGRRIDQIEREYIRVFGQEVKSALGIGTRYSAFLASSIIAVRMGLVHQWVTSTERDTTYKKQLLDLVETVLMKMVASRDARR